MFANLCLLAKMGCPQAGLGEGRGWSGTSCVYEAADEAVH